MKRDMRKCKSNLSLYIYVSLRGFKLNVTQGYEPRGKYNLAINVYAMKVCGHQCSYLMPHTCEIYLPGLPN
jgi:hypothetical protein